MWLIHYSQGQPGTPRPGWKKIIKLLFKSLWSTITFLLHYYFWIFHFFDVLGLNHTVIVQSKGYLGTRNWINSCHHLLEGFEQSAFWILRQKCPELVSCVWTVWIWICLVVLLQVFGLQIPARFDDRKIRKLSATNHTVIWRARRSKIITNLAI